MKKFAKIIALLLCFGIALEISQQPLHYRWSENEDVYSRNVTFKDEPEGSVDVLYFGTSEIYNDVFPTAMYEETGITGMNFAVSHKSAITTYSQVKYALKYQTPKVVCCDFSALFTNKLPTHGDKNEQIYRKIVDTMPDIDIRLQLIADMKLADKKTDVLSYLFPIFRYHSRWNNLSREDFLPDYEVSDKYKRYSAGCRLQMREYYEEARPEITEDTEITPALWDVTSLTEVKDDEVDLTAADGTAEEKTEDIAAETEQNKAVPGEEIPANVSVQYYDKMIRLCQKKGIQVVALIPPKIRDGALKTARMAAIEEYMYSRGVDIIDYNTYEEVNRLGVNLREHYCDAAHMNYKGAVIFSRDLARVLSEKYDLPDHRGDAAFTKWDSYWDEFASAYDMQ